jgi:hypothetical protein
MKTDRTTTTTAPAEKKLTREDLLRLELAQERLLSQALRHKILQLEDRVDELSVRNLALQNDNKQLELQVRRLERAQEDKKLLHLQSQAGGALETLKAELGKKYGVEDWSKVAYDDKTGLIHQLPG